MAPLRHRATMGTFQYKHEKTSEMNEIVFFAIFMRPVRNGAIAARCRHVHVSAQVPKNIGNEQYRIFMRFVGNGAVATRYYNELILVQVQKNVGNERYRVFPIFMRPVGNGVIAAQCCNGHISVQVQKIVENERIIFCCYR